MDDVATITMLLFIGMCEILFVIVFLYYNDDDCTPSI